MAAFSSPLPKMSLAYPLDWRQAIADVVAQVEAAGIAAERIVLGGFSLVLLDFVALPNTDE